MVDRIYAPYGVEGPLAAVVNAVADGIRVEFLTRIRREDGCIPMPR
jgi:hypothetical protein